jgi:hypothetical protein
MFTVMFSIGRMPGWIAHWKEVFDLQEEGIARPRQIYTGATSATSYPRRAREARGPEEPNLRLSHAAGAPPSVWRRGYRTTGQGRSAPGRAATATRQGRASRGARGRRAITGASSATSIAPTSGRTIVIPEAMTGTTRGFIGMLAVAALGSGCVKATAPLDRSRTRASSPSGCRTTSRRSPRTPAPATPAAGILPGLPPRSSSGRSRGPRAWAS